MPDNSHVWWPGYGRRRTGTLPHRVGAVVMLAGLAMTSACWADGWHNAVLHTPKDQYVKSINNSLSPIKAKIEEATSATVKGGPPDKTGKPPARVGRPKWEDVASPRAKLLASIPKRDRDSARLHSDAMLRLLAHLDRRNIVPGEFPNFDLKDIPELRALASDYLRQLGPIAADLVAQKLIDYFLAKNVGGIPASAKGGYGFTPVYVPELVDLLIEYHEMGVITDRELQNLAKTIKTSKHRSAKQVADGLLNYVHKKIDPRAQFYTAAFTHKDFSRELASSFYETITVRVKRAQEQRLKIPGFLVDLMTIDACPTKLKNEVLNILVDAKPNNLTLKQYRTLLNAATVTKHRDWLKQEVDRLAEVEKKREEMLVNSTPVELAAELPNLTGTLRLAALDRLKKIKFRVSYKENQKYLPALSSQLNAPGTAHDICTRILQSAYQVAPISSSLRDLSTASPALAEIIEGQLKARADRADAARKASYLKWARVVAHGEEETSLAQVAAAKYLLKIDPQQGITDAIAVLEKVSLPQKVVLAQALREATRQDFGPTADSGLLEVAQAIKKWKAWDKQRRSK